MSSDPGASPQGRTYRDLTGETIEQTLDLSTWDPAERLAEQFERVEREIEAAHAREAAARGEIRREILPLLKSRPGAPEGAGVHSVGIADLREIQQLRLFSGHVQAVDGASVMHETLPVTVVQTGVVMANYLGETGTWGHRVFQRDLRLDGGSGLEYAMDVLRGRSRENADDAPGMSDMLRRGVMMHGELNVLATRADAPWRMGHGHPLPKELLTGAGMPELIELSVPLLRKLHLEHKRVVYVPQRTNDRMLMTVASALLPLQYAIIQDVSSYLDGVIEQGHYGRQRFANAKVLLDEFREEAATKIIVGAYRVSPHGPAQIFYAHSDHAAEAALIAMADSVLVEPRSFPMLLDIAGSMCRDLFPPDLLVRAASTVHGFEDDYEGEAR